MRRILVILFLSLPFLAFCQICEGNIGENIFTGGDFGSGAINVVQTDPMIAPGYQYTTSPPPFDGLYTLSNNIALWNNNFGTWLTIGDNSNDPNGYMMIVNADFEPGLFYEQVVDGLCENTLYVFNADVINLIQVQVNDHIKPNVSFLIDGVQLYTTGDIAQDAQWKTYGFTFSTGPGQTSVTLSLRNNAPGGIGNDLGLDNIEFRPCGPEALILPTDIANICEDGTPIELEATIIGDQYQTPAYQWQQSFDEGQSWEDIPGENGPTFTHTDLSSGFYYYRYLLANSPSSLSNPKCRVVSNVKIVYVIPKFYEITDTLCEGLAYIVEDQAYDQTGIYVDSLISTIGCDSIVTLDLTIVPDQGLVAISALQDPGCADTEDGSILIESVANGTPPYTFSFANEPPVSNGFFGNLGDGEYTILIEDHFGCYIQEVFQLQSPPIFLVDIGDDLTIELGDDVDINPATNFQIESYSWFPEQTDCDPDCWNLAFFPTNSTPLVLNALSTDGCRASDSIFIEVIINRKVYFPNVFTPNFDGANDYFTLFGAEPNVQLIRQLTVFNRWGAIVFDQQDVLPNQETMGWDGTFKGKDAANGIYTWFAKILFLDGEVINYAGDVLLMR